jgi:hypothetical protein
MSAFSFYMSNYIGSNSSVTVTQHSILLSLSFCFHGNMLIDVNVIRIYHRTKCKDAIHFHDSSEVRSTTMLLIL